MKFNRYILELYLQSKDGNDSLEIWSEFLDWQNWQNLDYAKLVEKINSSLYLPKDVKELKNRFQLIKTNMLDNEYSKVGVASNKVSYLVQKQELQESFTELSEEEILKNYKNILGMNWKLLKTGLNLSLFLLN